MSRMKLTIDIEKERQEIAKYATGIAPFDLERLALLYGRQSTMKQTVNNLESAKQQSAGLVNRAIELGWIEEAQRILLVENSVAKRMQLSGTLRIDQRPGLKAVTEWIDAGKASAVIVVEVSRLFRDETGIEPATFAAKCKKAHCIIITDDYTYDFNNPKRDDTLLFLAEAAAAAKELKRIKKRLLVPRQNKAESGKLANGVVAIGLTRKYELNEKGILKGDFLEPSPHSAQVASVYQRFMELDANIVALFREIVMQAKRGIPLFPVVDGIDPKTVKLTPMHKDGVLIGWTIKSLFGLRYLLSNPTYDGHLVWNGVVVKYNAHTAIVPHTVWQFAFDHLARVDMNGQPITRETRTVRYQQKDSKPLTALLSGVRDNGKAVIDGVNGAHVYVQHNNSIYVLRNLHKHTVNGFETGINIAELDSIFEKQLLRILEMSEHLADRDGDIRNVTINAVLPVMHQIAYKVDKEGTSQPANDTDRLEVITNDMRKVQRDLDDAGDVMDRDTRREKYAKLATLKQQHTEEQARIATLASNRAKLERAKQDVQQAYQKWNGWDSERKQHLVRLVTESITLQEIADGWLLLTVQWSAVLGSGIAHCYIWRPNGSLWNENEKEILRLAYSSESRKAVLYLLPKRSWTAIRRKAFVMGIERDVRGDDSDLSSNLSISDRMVASEYGLKLTHSEFTGGYKTLSDGYEEPIFVEKPGIEPVQWHFEQARNDTGSSSLVS